MSVRCLAVKALRRAVVCNDCGCGNGSKCNGERLNWIACMSETHLLSVGLGCGISLSRGLQGGVGLDLAVFVRGVSDDEKGRLWRKTGAFGRGLIWEPCEERGGGGDSELA